jgi:lipid-A-disaccharide synthase-like uncharacterized protein
MQSREMRRLDFRHVGRNERSAVPAGDWCICRNGAELVTAYFTLWISVGRNERSTVPAVAWCICRNGAELVTAYGPTIVRSKLDERDEEMDDQHKQRRP